MTPILHDVLQNSPEWESLRRVYITASAFEQFITPARLQASTAAGSRDYMLDVAMRLLGAIDAPVSARQLEWGHEHEPDAIALYEAIMESRVLPVGFVSLPDFERPGIGCSPDGFVDDDGGVEVKCHWTPREHAKVRLDGIPHKHRLQIEATLWITGRDWWDYVSYLPKPRMESVEHSYRIIRVLRDEQRIARIAELALSFRQRVAELLPRLAA